VRVLIVDDDPAILKMFGELLRSAGHEVMPCARGAQAINHALMTDFDLVICDLSLPDVHGLDIIRAIKAQSPHTPILVVSALDPAEWAADVASAGAARFIQKPVRLDDIRRELGLAERSLVRLSALVFDDDETHCNRVRVELSRRGSVAFSLASAAELAEEGIPGVVLVDARHADVHEVLAWAKERAIPTFVYADKGIALDDDRLMRAGASLVMTKPVDDEALLTQARFLGAGGGAPW
jgi:DNA-binding response OmpR family regulator